MTLLVVDLVERHSLTAYDADHLALAISTDADLATTDRRLATAAAAATAAGAAGAAGTEGRAILVGARTGLAEAPAAYHGRVPTWVAWPGSRTYLAELRARLRPTTD